MEDAQTFNEAVNFLDPRETFAILNSSRAIETLLQLASSANSSGFEPDVEHSI